MYVNIKVHSIICHMKILIGYGYSQSYMELSNYIVVCLFKDSTVFFNQSHLIIIMPGFYLYQKGAWSYTADLIFGSTHLSHYRPRAKRPVPEEHLSTAKLIVNVLSV